MIPAPASDYSGFVYVSSKSSSQLEPSADRSQRLLIVLPSSLKVPTQSVNAYSA
jgi:hypothetical protein